MPSRRFLALPALLLVAACSLGPDYERPVTATPAAWKAQATAGAGDWPAPDWWRAFGAPEVETLIRQAQAGNTDLGIAAARVQQADAQVRIAGSSLLPTLDAGGNATRARSSDLRGSGRTTSARYSATLNASYEIDVWGKNRAGVTAARSFALSSRLDRDTVLLTVTASVASTYFQILELQDRLAISRENLANASRVLAVVDARSRNGAASALDLAQQRTVVANQRAVIPALEQQLRQTENALALLLGATPDQVDVARKTLDSVTVPTVNPGMPSELLQRRPDVQAAEAALVGANADIQAARAALFPSIALTAQGGFESLVIGSLFSPAGAFAAVGASVVQSIFDGGRRAGQVELTEAQYQELVEVYRQAVIAAFGDVENALIATRQVAERERELRAAVGEARTAFRLAELQYREGAVDLLTVLESQRAFFQAQDQIVQSKSQRLQAAVSLYRALGGGWSA